MTWRRTEQEKQRIKQMFWLPEQAKRFHETARYRCSCAFCRTGRKKRTLQQIEITEDQISGFPDYEE